MASDSGAASPNVHGKATSSQPEVSQAAEEVKRFLDDDASAKEAWLAKHYADVHRAEEDRMVAKAKALGHAPPSRPKTRRSPSLG